MSLCRRCLLEPAKGHGLGPACLEYQRRTGQPRPGRIIERHASRLSDKHARKHTA